MKELSKYCRDIIKEFSLSDEDALFIEDKIDNNECFSRWFTLYDSIEKVGSSYRYLYNDFLTGLGFSFSGMSNIDLGNIALDFDGFFILPSSRIIRFD